ncbi:MAG: hypothetical protein GTO18_19120 [Anaerolineales bacterium]|nr:hypothetical protein [Anaerolineales bacterium]
MQVTRDVILDIMPLYFAGEVSADTRSLVEEYLKTDPELAELANEPAAMELPEDIQIPLTEEDKMEAYKEAKRLMFLRTIILTITISFTLICLLALLGSLGLAFLRF